MRKLLLAAVATLGMAGVAHAQVYILSAVPDTHTGIACQPFDAPDTHAATYITEGMLAEAGIQFSVEEGEGGATLLHASNGHNVGFFPDPIGCMAVQDILTKQGYSFTPGQSGN